ncbi:DNA cytosine methyltransferase [Alicyclobacillus acidoterrestris]|uniref:DNA cytosine methyltransferase n=1 Tax=Alicyclobacillus acidoterrestris (strain ATCC 49025 / DSM 3922 / CIP 106132 / NCIMB 13137 / GD3B) TaxID=1356854 RepID=T0C461_ALIAG|nr:DNA cytosine methyltransferase [Alicyclobacillus acidoterrestris]EPZ47355.1 hypothetical protein N007_06400 [Alicyclobacillus acidoterrestris ATCC 49025]UNO49056.1 DNA cytosine methyltransferase [Alicyclobacillus acidoterrestris]
MKHQSGMNEVDTTIEALVSAVDLFSGAGGLTNGLERSGIDVRLGIDIDPACAYPYTANNKANFVLKSVEDVTAEEINDAFTNSRLRLLAGCAPCQTFSTYNQRARETDSRWWLLLQFARIVKEVSPELVTMENVPNLERQNVFQEFVQTLKDEGYKVSYQIVNCAEYGIPQQRKRLVLLASKLGAIKLLDPSLCGSGLKSVRDAIGDLPPLEAGGKCDMDPLHRCSSLSPINLRRIRASRPGGSWRDWDKELIAECHKKKTGKSYPGVYGRMEWDQPAPTITTQFFGFGNGRFGHPEQDRALSLREGAILQSFPRDYKFVAPDQDISIATIGRLIGNAVPVKLGEVIGRSILAHVNELECRAAVLSGGMQYA